MRFLPCFRERAVGIVAGGADVGLSNGCLRGINVPGRAWRNVETGFDLLPKRPRRGASFRLRFEGCGALAGTVESSRR